VLGTVVEVAAWFVEGRLALRGIVYRPHPMRDYADYLRRRDPLLGWPPRGWSELDASGSRPVPAFPDPSAKACASLYGDSFTWAVEVRPEAAWGNVLAERLGCRVSNFGMGGYGTDQAYLRFANNSADDAPVVLLGHMAENVVRNVNRLRPLLSAAWSDPLAILKPRFVLAADGALELIPLPTLSAAEYADMVRDPAAHLAHEALLPDTEWGPVHGGFPYTVSVLRALWTWRARSYFAGKYYWDAFYRPDHPTQALAITTAIAEAFARDARRRGRQPVVVVFPAYADLVARVRGDAWSYRPLLDALEARGVAVLDVGDPLLDRRPDADPARLFTPTAWHYNATANRLVAEIVAAFLEDRGLVRRAP
jgi:hypothetical protein